MLVVENMLYVVRKRTRTSTAEFYQTSRQATVILGLWGLWKGYIRRYFVSYLKVQIGQLVSLPVAYLSIYLYHYSQIIISLCFHLCKAALSIGLVCRLVCFLQRVCRMVCNCGFTLLIIACCGIRFSSYLLFFLDCHISNNIICVIISANFMVGLFLFLRFRVIH